VDDMPKAVVNGVGLHWELEGPGGPPMLLMSGATSLSPVAVEGRRCVACVRANAAF